MDTSLVVAVAFVILASTILIEVPVAFALATAGLVGMLLLRGPSVAWQIMAHVPYSATSPYQYVQVALFILMGTLVARSGLAGDVYDVVALIVRRLYGGIAVATVVAAVFIGGITGSSAADVATIGTLAIGEMQKRGYRAAFAAAVVASSGTIAILVPPSVALIVYGILTQESIGKLLIAGIVPGVLSAAVLSIFIALRVRFSAANIMNPVRSDVAKSAVSLQAAAPRAASSTTPSQDRIATSAQATRPRVLELVPALLSAMALFGVVIGGIYSGAVTTTEAGALGATAAFVLVFLRIRSVASLKSVLHDGLAQAASIVIMVFALILGSSIFTFFLVDAGVPDALTTWVLRLPLPPKVVIGLLLLAFIPMGTFLEGLSMLLVTVPIVYPIVRNLGFDGIWFGILMIKVVEISLIAPPLGLNVYVLGSIRTDIRVDDIFRQVLPFIVADVCIMAIIFFVPEIVTWLPNLAHIRE